MPRVIECGETADMPDPNVTTDALDQALSALLSSIPPNWKPLDSDALTATEQEALKLLTGAGLAERRFGFRLCLLGHTVIIEATITATGEQGLGQAVEPVANAAWQAWADEYRKYVGHTAGGRPQIHCEKTESEMGRLTSYGQEALADLQSGQEKMVLDFIRR